jgi:hypothetical protein
MKKDHPVEPETHDLKALPSRPPIAKPAIESGFEYGRVARHLMMSGQIESIDPRTSSDICDNTADLTISRKSFIAQADFHTGRARDAAGKLGVSDPLKSIFALSSKLIGSIKNGAAHNGMESGMLAISVEEAAILLEQGNHPRRLVRDMARFSARTTDSVVLASRALGFDGVISTMALKNDYSLPLAARDLKRIGAIDPLDPRLHPNVAVQANASNQLPTGEFLKHMKSGLWSDMDRLSKMGDSPFSRASILKDTAILVEQQADRGGSTEANKNGRYALFMETMARIGEKMAVNLVVGGKDPDRSKSTALLGYTASAVERSRIYTSRERVAQRDATRNTVASRGRGRMM